MKKIKQWLAVTAAALALSLGGKALAQPQGMNFQGMDPEQMMNMIQQRINEALRTQMGVTNDDEWSIIAERISIVTKARIATMADEAGMMGGGGMRGGGGFQAILGQPSLESQALRQAIDSDAPKAQIQTLLEKFQAARKEKEKALAKAEGDLRAVLTTRQEAIAVLNGLLK